MKLICILMGLSSMGLMLGLVISVLWGASEQPASGSAADGVNAGSARAPEQ